MKLDLSDRVFAATGASGNLGRPVAAALAEAGAARVLLGRSPSASPAAGERTLAMAAGRRAGGSLRSRKSRRDAPSREISAELNDQDVNVNCALPSVIDTPENRAAMPKADAERSLTSALIPFYGGACVSA